MINILLLDISLFFNLKKLGLFFLNETYLSSFSLKKIKKIYFIAVEKNDVQLQETCLKQARINYPKGTFSYVEEAKNKIKDSKYKQALNVLNNSPQSKEVNSLKEHIMAIISDVDTDGLMKIPTLSDISKVYEYSVIENDEQLQRDCLDKARKHFPKHSFSYVEEAKNKIDNEDLDGAWMILKESPRSSEVQNLKEEIISYDSTYKNIALEEELMKVNNLIKLKPFYYKHYDKLFNLLEQLSRNKEIIKLAEYLPFLGKPLNIKSKFALVNSYTSYGNQKKALEHLLVMQKEYPMDRRILHKLSDIYKSDRQVSRAYIYVLLAEATYPIYGAIRRLTFESDHNMINEGVETFDRVLDFKDTDLIRFMSMVNRVSCFYPEQIDNFVESREKVKKAIEKNILKNNSDFNKNLKFLLTNRWFASAVSFKEKALEHGFNVNKNILSLYEKIESNLVYDSKDIISWLEIADKNEKTDVLLGVNSGFPVDLDKLDKDTVKIELFIPNAFFTPPEDEKPSFKTAQEYFRLICETLQSFEDVVIIPRHQFNWRKVYRKTDFKAVSYHTFNEVNDPNWLHVQESTLANRCSIDTMGFAGYSKMANDFTDIEEYTKNIDDIALDKNYNFLHKEYVSNNVSKYLQNEESFSSDDDYVFVALQVLTDIVADIAYFDAKEMLKTVVQHYKNSSTKVVVKRHPYCNSISVQLLIEELLAVGDIIVTDASIHSIIEDSKAIFVVNSGVGFESLMHLKPVIVCGECDYAYAVSAQTKTPKALSEYLEKNDFTMDEHKIKKFLYYYVNNYNPEISQLPEILKKWIYDK